MTLIIQKPTGAKLNLRKDYVPLDPNFSKVSLLLHGDGSNGSTVIADSSQRMNGVTAVSGAQITTSESLFGGASISLAASNSYLSIPRSDSFDFATGDFTIEAWIKFNSGGDLSIVGGIGPTSGTLMLRRLAAGSLGLGRNHIAFDTVSSVLSWNTTRFYHLAVIRSSGTVYMFRDGSQIGSGANTQSYALAASTDTVWGVGATQATLNTFSPGLFLNGYVEDLRITKGVARYTSNFSVPTTAFPDAIT